MWTIVTDCCVKIAHQITRRKSVLYVCERVNNNLGGSMATTRNSSSKYGIMSEQQQQHQDPSHSFPVQVALPDGEVRHHDYEPCLRLSGAQEQEAELTRGYIKPPENKCLCELERIKPHLSCSMGILSGRDASNIIRSCGPSSAHHQQQQRSYSTTTALHPIHRHSSPLDASHHCHRSTTTSSSLSSSSSSSMSSWSFSGAVGEDSRQSVFAGRKHNLPKQFLFLSQSHEKISQDRSKRRKRPVGSPESRTAASASLQSQSPLLACPSAPTALSDIAVLPCGTAYSSPHFPTTVAEDQAGRLQWDQQRLQFGTYRHTPRGYSTPSADEEPPPIYTDVIDNPSTYRSVSRPTEHRTDNDKI